MARKFAFQAFLKAFQIEAREPLSETEIQKVEAKLGFALPESLRSCYLICDGGKAVRDPEDPLSDLQVFSLKAALDYHRNPWFFTSFWGYFPFAENNDSNPVCVCCKSPLVGYVVLVLHDDVPRLMFRSLDTFFRAAMDYIKDGEFFDTHDLPSEFDGPERTKKDLAIARELIELVAAGDTLHDQDRTSALRFACDLLPNDNVDEISALLQDEDEYVREHVAGRLKRIPGENASKAISQFKSDFDAFVKRCAQLLQREAIQASVHESYGKKTIRIDPGPIWLNMEMFYSQRHRHDFDAFLLERARYFLDEKKKRGGRV